jgi:hypothetical protein
MNECTFTFILFPADALTKCDDDRQCYDTSDYAKALDPTTFSFSPTIFPPDVFQTAHVCEMRTVSPINTCLSYRSAVQYFCIVVFTLYCTQ